MGHRTAAKTTERFILLTPFVDYKFFDSIRSGVADAAQALGVHAEFTGTPDGDVGRLASIAWDALDGGYDGIALNMTDPDAFDAVAQEAADRKIPLISFNVDGGLSNARLATVGQNMREAGKTFGEEVARMIPVGSRALVTMHDLGITALEDRASGARVVLEQVVGGWSSLITGTDREPAIARIRAALLSDRSIRVVLGTGAADTEAAGLTVERYFPDEGLVVAGFDTSDEILRLVRSNAIRLTIDQQPYAQGYCAIVALTLAKRHRLRPPKVDTGAIVIRH
jgi:simple sugar transport system substrate-binding protein